MKNIIIFCFVVFFVTNIFAQEKEVPSITKETAPTSQDTLMPKIDNPEFVITKEEYLTPQLVERQLADEDKIYQVTTKSISLLPNTDQQKKTQHQLQREREIMSGKVLLSFGSYSTPAIEGWFGKNYETSGILFHGMLYQTDGHVSNADKQKGNIELGGNISLLNLENSLSFLEKSRGQVKLGIGIDNYGLFGSKDSSKNRSVNNFSFNGNILQSEYNPSWLSKPLSYQLQLGINVLSMSDFNDLTEDKFSLSATSSTTINSVTYQLFSQYQSVYMREGHQSYYFRNGLNFDYRWNREINTSLQLTEIFYRGTQNNSQSQFGGNFLLTYQYSNPLQLTFTILRDVKKLSIQDYLEINPYVSSLTALNHMTIPIQLSVAGLYRFSEKLQLRSDLAFRSAEDRPFYKADTNKMFDAIYFNSNEIIASATVTYQNDFKHNLIISGKYNLPVDSREVLPYVPVLEVLAKYQMPIIENLSSTIDLQLSSPRGFGFKKSDGKTESIFKLSGRIDYNILNNLTAVLRMENLLNSKYKMWEGYNEPGIFISLGAAYRW